MAADSFDQAQQALAIARQIDDPALLVRALTACGPIAVISAEPAGSYFAEAVGLARALGDPWRLSQILAWQARTAATAGDLIALRAAGEEGRDLAEAIGNRFASRQCRWCLAVAQYIAGDLAGAAAQFGAVAAEAEAAHDVTYQAYGLAGQGMVLASQGQMRAARAAADAAVEAAAELGGLAGGLVYIALGSAALAAGDAVDGPRRKREGLAALAGPARAGRMAARVSVRRPRWRAGIWSRPGAAADRGRRDNDRLVADWWR